jgi:transcription antitermination factor NusG
MERQEMFHAITMKTRPFKPGDCVVVTNGEFSTFAGRVVSLSEARRLNVDNEGETIPAAEGDAVWVALSLFNTRVPMKFERSSLRHL